MKAPDWTGVRCQEVYGMVGDVYLRCGAPPVGIVWHIKDDRAYPMCLPCLDHNVRNRGGQLLCVKEKE